MKKLSHKNKTIATLLAMFFTGTIFSQTNPTAQTLPYTQNFGTTTFSTVPVGMAAWTVNSSPIGSQTNAQNNTANGDATVHTATVTQTTGDVYGYSTSSNGRLYIQTSSNATNGTSQPVLAINTVGWSSVAVSFDIEMISTNPRTIGFVLQYRIGTSGSWTNVTGGVYSHNNSDRTNGQVDNFTNLSLPSGANNQSVVQLRWAVWRGTQTGNSSGAALDNISVTASSSQVAGYFRSKQNGNWNSLSTWQASGDSATWVNATTIPDYHANSILVKDSVSITATDSIDQTTVSTTGILTYANVTGSVLNIKNGTGIDLNILGKFYDAGPTSLAWTTGAKWQMGSGASLIRNRGTSSSSWRDNYNNGITNIPANSNWYIVKNSSDNPSLSSTSGSKYGNLYILNTTGSLWTTPSGSSFTGSTDFPIVKGNLYVGNNVSFLNNNTNASPTLVNGDLTLASGSTLRNRGTGFEIQGNLTISGTDSTTGSSYILLSGSNSKTISGSSANFYNLKLNKASAAAAVTLNSSASIRGALTFTKGYLISTTTNLLSFKSGSSVSGVNDSAFVNGPVKKIGNTSFHFPIGKGNNYQGITISAPANATDAYQSEYFNVGQTISSNHDSIFGIISPCEYFNLQRTNGTSNVEVNLDWDLANCSGSFIHQSPSVIEFDGTKWANLGTDSVIFSTSGGTIASAGLLSNYGYLTMGFYYMDPNAKGIYAIQQQVNVDLNDTAEDGPKANIRKYMTLWNGQFDTNGTFSTAAQNYYSFAQHISAVGRSSSGTCNSYNPQWNEIGPTMLANNSNGLVGAGQIYNLTFHPQYGVTSDPDEQTIFALSQYGGIWKTVDDGENWSRIDPNCTILYSSVGNLVIDKSFPNIMYVSTGSKLSPVLSVSNANRTADYPTWTVGVYKTVDGGNSWVPINNGIDPLLFTGGAIYNLQIDPNNHENLIFSSTAGVHYCINAYSGGSNPTWIPDAAFNTAYPDNARVGLTYNASTFEWYISGVDIYTCANPFTSVSSGHSWILATGGTSGLDFNTGVFFGHSVQYIKVFNSELSGRSSDIYALIYTNAPSTGKNVVIAKKSGAASWSIATSVFQNYRSVDKMAFVANTNPDNLTEEFYFASNNYYYFNSFLMSSPTGTNPNASGIIDLHQDVQGLFIHKNRPDFLWFISDGGISKKQIPGQLYYTGAHFKNKGIQAHLLWEFDDSEQDMDYYIGALQDISVQYKGGDAGSSWKMADYDGDGFLCSILDKNPHDAIVSGFWDSPPPIKTYDYSPRTIGGYFSDKSNDGKSNYFTDPQNSNIKILIGGWQPRYKNGTNAWTTFWPIAQNINFNYNSTWFHYFESANPPYYKVCHENYRAPNSAQIAYAITLRFIDEGPSSSSNPNFHHPYPSLLMKSINGCKSSA
jgi:hypothetical protein